MTAHDLADSLDIWRATCADDLCDLLEIARAEKTGADDPEEASLVVARVVEAMDDTALDEGIHHVAFAVDDIDAAVAIVQAHGGELVDRVQNYKDIYRLCDVRGQEGIIVELAERIG